MRQLSPAVLILGVLLFPLTGTAQTHKVAKPEQVVRAVGVYEWTGDLKKPTASRLVPVSVFIDGSLEDAGVYLARPIPFALTPGNEYELQQSGLTRGALELAYATHLQTADAAYEDGWFGYGSYKAPPAAKKEPALRASKSPAVLASSKDDSRPHFGGRNDAQDKTQTEPGKTDPNQTAKDPTPANSSDPSTTKSSGSTSADGADRPTMRRRSDTSTSTSDPTTTASSGSTPADDPDRPTLRRRSPGDAKKNKKANDVATVTGTAGSLNDDPDRPKLQRGARSSANDTEMAKLVGVPKDLQQMIAVSDAVNRSPHDFARPWQDEKERAAVLGKMQALARAQLVAYSKGSDAAAPSKVADANGTSPAKATHTSTSSSTASSTAHRTTSSVTKRTAKTDRGS